MPTIKQLPAATSVAATDLLPLSQGGATKALSVGSLLSSVQPAISLAQSKLLGRVSASAGGPEVVGVGAGLAIGAGALVATGLDHLQLPTSTALLTGDEVVVNSSGFAKRMVATSLRSLFTAGAGIAIDGSGAISALAGGSAPIATAGSVGLVQVGSGLSVSSSGTLTPDGSIIALRSALGSSAVLNVGTTAGTVAAGDDGRLLGAVQATGLGRTSVVAAGGTGARTLGDHLAGTLSVLDYAPSGTVVDRTGQVDASAAFQAVYAAAGAGQAITVPAGHYRINTPPVVTGGKVVAWHTHNATDVPGADLTALLGSGHLVLTANRGGTISIAEHGTNFSLLDIFGGDSGTKLDVISSGNAIIGYAVQQQVGSQGFPTGVTGYSDVRSVGTQAFGLYGQSNLYTNGVATNELDAFNYAGPPSTLLPPNRGFATPENNAITLTIGGGSGSYPASIGIDIERSGQSMLTGVYVAPDATINNGIMVDATAAAGPTNPLIVKGRPGVVPIAVLGVGAVSATSALQTWGAGGSTQATIYQDGTFESAGFRLGGDGTVSLKTVAVSGSVSGSAAGYFQVLVDGTAARVPYFSASGDVASTAFVASAVAASRSTGVRVVTAAGPVSIGAGDGLVVIRKAAGSATAVTLEANPAVGATHSLKDGRGDAATNAITVTPAAGAIDGAGSYVMSTAFEAVTLVYDGAQWSVI